MSRTHWTSLVVLFAFLALIASGCGEGGRKKSRRAAKHDHSHWWCAEHGIPEEMCSMCDPKVAADFKAKSDWCEKHDRADSQCFICHPEYEAKFAAMYESKYGKKPPERKE